MIASVTGTVEAVGLDHAVLGVGGIGVAVHATPTTLAGLVVGRQARLATSLVVREDSLTLFGFADDDERAVFTTLQTVSGVGPRLALAVLAVHTPDSLRRAVTGEDLAALQRVPGIGRKGAQRIVLEVGDKLGAPAPGPDAPAAVPPPGTDGMPDVVAALVQLGWTEKVADGAVHAVLAAEDAPREVPAVLRAALQHLGGQHG
ncbi:Holliday junction branch migration protein RuvA [Georgenia sp. TF02-10]|uniref:Holliday junction branch migration protein RuvA n=1 Tax=Georgenia sp. TF02-10 TaxID=2917725 RepID=UPI001FA6EB0A|nr:Holliday junction branch migration protein RuvA [Georgenia sp. TF02-10]UNX53279.1 Holliday junction branch migration protein RuvA [Georgenia sp. TF02-10]